jgi:hypothetical protein
MGEHSLSTKPNREKTGHAAEVEAAEVVVVGDMVVVVEAVVVGTVVTADIRN